MSPSFLNYNFFFFSGCVINGVNHAKTYVSFLCGESLFSFSSGQFMTENLILK